MASKEELAFWGANPGSREAQMAGTWNWGTPWSATAPSLNPSNVGSMSNNMGAGPGGGPNLPSAPGQNVMATDWNSIPGWAADLPGNDVQLPQYDPWASDTPHWGWNPGEAGPPGSEDWVRNPDKYKATGVDWNGQHFADPWEARFYYFMQDEDHKRMLDPRWRPINAWYNAQNPNAHAILGEVARGERDLWGWTPQAAQQQLEGWGVKWQPEAPSGGDEYSNNYGGGRTWNPGGAQPPSRVPQKQPTEDQLRKAFPGLYPTAVGPADATLGNVKSPMWTDNAGLAWSGYQQNTPGGGGSSGLDGSLRPMKQVLTPAGPMWVPA